MSAQRNLSSVNLQLSVGPLPTNRGVHQKSNTCSWNRIFLISQAFLLKIQYAMKPRKTYEEGTDERICLIDEDGRKFHDGLSIIMHTAFSGTTSKEAHPYSPPHPSTLHSVTVRQMVTYPRDCNCRLCDSQPIQDLIRDRRR